MSAFASSASAAMSDSVSQFAGSFGPATTAAAASFSAESNFAAAAAASAALRRSADDLPPVWLPILAASTRRVSARRTASLAMSSRAKGLTSAAVAEPAVSSTRKTATERSARSICFAPRSNLQPSFATWQGGCPCPTSCDAAPSPDPKRPRRYAAFGRSSTEPLRRSIVRRPANARRHSRPRVQTTRDAQ